MSFVIRSATPPSDLVATVANAVRETDANLALAQVRTLQGLVDSASEQMAFTMVLIAIAAIVALMLGVIGIYGVMSYLACWLPARRAARLSPIEALRTG